MLESNRLWLEQANPQLLENYKEDEAPKPDEFLPLNMIRMSHEGRNHKIDPTYISPKYYIKQEELIETIEAEDIIGEIKFCVLGGIQSGHLLNETISKHQIKNLIIVEPDTKSFHQSLSVTDWPALFEDFDSRGGTIFLHLGEMTIDIKQRIAIHIQDIGPYNASVIFANHDGTDAGAYAVKDVFGCIQDCINSLGFYDDEKVGLTHTISHMEAGARFLTSPPPKPWIDKPAVVCGNGPSLDKIIPHLKERRGDIFLVACGSTVRTMFLNDLKPDLYIEQERAMVTSEYIRHSTTPEYRDGITAISLNTVHPQVKEMWKDHAFVLKSNDFGALVASGEMNGAPLLKFVNPQAANAGLSITSSLGFKNIYLAGVDCAFSEDGEDHAKGYGRDARTNNNIKTKGNFRDEVMTNQLYLDSKQAHEYCIRANPKISYHNLGDGAHIEGAVPTKRIRLTTGRELNKSQLYAPFKPFNKPFDSEAMRQRIVDRMESIKSLAVSIPKKIKGKEEAFFHLDLIYAHLKEVKAEDLVFWYLVKGSIVSQLVFMAHAANFEIQKFDESSAIFKEFIKACHFEMKGNFFHVSMDARPEDMPEDVN